MSRPPKLTELLLLWLATYYLLLGRGITGYVYAWCLLYRKV